MREVPTRVRDAVLKAYGGKWGSVDEAVGSITELLRSLSPGRAAAPSTHTVHAEFCYCYF